MCIVQRGGSKAEQNFFFLVCGRSFGEPERINFLLHCPYKQNFSC